MNVGVHVCVILNDVFSQYRPGIGVKILGLTLEIFCSGLWGLSLQEAVSSVYSHGSL